MLALEYRSPVVQAAHILHSVGVGEVVLRAGSVQAGRPVLPVYEYHVIPLAPPAAVHIVDTEITADVGATSLGFQDYVVVTVGQIRRLVDALVTHRDARFSPAPAGVLPTPARVDVHRLILWPLVLLVVNVEVEIAPLATFIAHLDARRIGKRHRQPAVEGTPVAVIRAGHVHRNRFTLPDDAVPAPEEIPHRHLNAGMLIALPVHAEDHAARPGRLVGPRRHPDVCDAAGAPQIGDGQRRAGLRVPPVLVLALGLVTAGAPVPMLARVNQVA